MLTVRADPHPIRSLEVPVRTTLTLPERSTKPGAAGLTA